MDSESDQPDKASKVRRVDLTQTERCQEHRLVIPPFIGWSRGVPGWGISQENWSVYPGVSDFAA